VGVAEVTLSKPASAGEDEPSAGRDSLRLGIDVGGTNTDAVLMTGGRVLGWDKAHNSKDVTTGIESAIRGVLAVAHVEPRRIAAVMLGTTHFTNAVVEARRLTPTAAVRIGLPSTAGIPPMTDWPDALAGALRHDVFLCRGGVEVDGRPIVPLDEEELRSVAKQVRRRRLRSVAIASVFSPVDPAPEKRAAAIFRAEAPEVAVSVSHEIGRVGLLERENATILNACLRDLAYEITDALGETVRAVGIRAPVYISQNDGTLMNLEYCRSYPVMTFASGPTNSMRGAAYLSGETDCIVMDVGGTTTDVGVLTHGFPRVAGVSTKVAGVRTNFRMPELTSVGIGGGSVVRGNAQVSMIGPDSVGHEITHQALVFGGSTVTATDLAVAAGLCRIGSPERVRRLSPRLVRSGVRWIQEQVTRLVDGAKVGPEALPVVVVGGGSVLVSASIPGASRVIRPKHFAVANAIGAAIAQVGGETDKVFSLTSLSREAALRAAQREALDKAVRAGADPADVDVVDIEEIPLSYLPSNAVRIRVKAVGTLKIGATDVAAGG
jgi:N-methylhydantoinase A/oxoprolinase/acetone carboxylase beta subunit